LGEIAGEKAGIFKVLTFFLKEQCLPLATKKCFFSGSTYFYIIASFSSYFSLLETARDSSIYCASARRSYGCSQEQGFSVRCKCAQLYLVAMKDCT